MTPPLSVSFIIMLSSIVNDFIEFCCEMGKLYLILSFLVGVSEISTPFEMKVSKSLFLPLGGIQFDLFHTSDSSVPSSLPSKYSVSLIFLVISIMSSCNSCILGFVDVGVYLYLCSNNLISFSFNFLEDKLTI